MLIVYFESPYVPATVTIDSYQPVRNSSALWLTRAEFDVVEDYVDEHHEELVDADRRAEEFIQQGIASQGASGMVPEIDSNVPQEQRLARLKAKLYQRRAAKNG